MLRHARAGVDHMHIHLEHSFSAPPDRLFRVLTDRADFMACTDGRPTELSTEPGSAFSLFGGLIHGRQIELIPVRTIVQAWRFQVWPEGLYSLVRLTLAPEGAGCRLALDQDGIPEGASPMFPSWTEHVSVGWPMFYFEPIAAALRKGA
ncbi:MAG: SRPBCC domain-containing protein [Hyphomicrobiales bacterium]|nr:SRPBCC domain-containing protein [Hyphomicrobiales bacterium]